jgi:prolyl oligopeptidase
MNVRLLRGLLGLAFLLQFALAVSAWGQMAPASGSKPPVAEVLPVTDDYFGNKVVDPYRWMEVSPPAGKFLDFLKAQSEYTRSVLAPLAGPREKLLNRIKELDNAVASVGSPTRAGKNIFFLQTNPGARNGSLMVRGADGAVRTLLDPEKFSTKDAHAAIDYFVPNFDGSMVAAGVSQGGSEQSTIHVIETASGRMLADAITRGQVASPSWREDGKSFYYARLQQLPPNAPATAYFENIKTFLHVVGNDPEKDRAVFGAGVSPNVNLPITAFTWIATAPNCPFALALSTSGTTEPVTLYVARMDQATNEKTPWQKVLSTEDGLAIADFPPSNAVIALDMNHPDLARAKTVIPESDDVLEGVYAAEDALYIVKRAGVGVTLWRQGYDSAEAPQLVQLPYRGSVEALDANTANSGVLFVLGSWTKANAAFAYDPAVREAHDLGIMPKNPADYSRVEAREVMIPSTDGAQVPLSILCLKDIKLDGSHPTLYEGYGAYGSSWDPEFVPRLLAWIERGGVFAAVHPRGGGEYGEKWRLAGYKKTKQHTIDDVIAAGRYLIKEGYSSPEHLSVQGGSAGGVAVGGAITQRPELFAGAVDNVGDTDLLRAQTMQSGPANISEFGDVNIKEEYECMSGISAYQHVKKGTSYPAVIGITGVNDPRVASWQVAKFISALQAANTSGRPILLRADFDAGHGVGSSRIQREEQIADVWTFLLWQSGDAEFQVAGK